MPKVSIITPCYNSEKYVAQTIQSIRLQLFTDWEHIVVDDGSTDCSRSIIETFAGQEPRIRLVVRHNGGMVQARISGFEAASQNSAYLLFLDADDCAEPNMLEQLVRYLDLHPEVGLVHCAYRFMDAQDNFINHPYNKDRYVPHGIWLRKLPPDHPETPFISVFNLCPMISSISLMRRTVYEQVNGYDETFGIHREDTDLFLRIALWSKIHYVPERLVRRRCHSNQDTTDSAEFRQRAYLQTQKLYAKWKKGEGLTCEQKKMVRAAWHFKQGIVEPYEAFLRAYEYLREGNLLKALRFYIGGIKYYFLSFFPRVKI